MVIDDATVAEIERLYTDTTMTLAEIGTRYGRSATSISHLARSRGWPMRWERMGRAPRRTIPTGPRAKAALMARLCAAATRQLEQMEKGMETGDLDAADYERLAKSVSAMIGGMEKVAAVQDGGDAERKPGAGKPAGAPDAERMRREIAERLERIAKQRLARDGAG